MAAVANRGNYIKEQLIAIYDRLLELYVLTDDAYRRGDKSECIRHQAEIDRLRSAMEQLKKAGSAQ